jgi:hypothetical protein
VVLCLVVLVVVDYRCMVVMRGRAVMVLRMIVPEILVHMQRRSRGRRDDQDLNKGACDEATHRVSVYYDRRSSRANRSAEFFDNADVLTWLGSNEPANVL